MAQPIVKIRGVSKSFGSKRVLDNVNFDINEGEIFGVIGASGVGKTTLLQCIVGFYPLSKGDIGYRIDNKGVYTYYSIKKHLKDLTSSIGFSMQDPSFYNKLTVKENLDYFATLYDIPKRFIPERIRKVLDLVELTGEENTMAENLSGGMQKRLDIACSMINNPKVLILDEPTADLDPVLRKHIWDLLKKINSLGKTIIISSHFLEEMDALCDRIALIKDKTITHVGTTEDLRKQYPYNKEIVLNLASRDYKKLASKLKNLPITKITQRGERMVIYTQQAERVLKHLVKEVDEDDLLELEVQRPTLDEVFASLIEKK